MLKEGVISMSIAVIGISGIFPGAKSVEEFWENIKKNVESIQTFSDDELLQSGITKDKISQKKYVKRGTYIEEAETFDYNAFKITKREAELMDPQHRLFLEHSFNALTDAGCIIQNEEKKTGVFACEFLNTYLLNNLYTNKKTIGLDYFKFMDDTVIRVENEKDYLATFVSYKLGLTGPSITIQSSCSSSMACIHYGCQSLLNGECDVAVAGGISVRFPQKNGYLYNEDGILSPDGHVRTFDESAKGMVFGNGCGVVILKRLEDAIEDNDHIYAVIKASTINNDGFDKIGYTAPSVTGQSDAITETLALAEVDAESIGYIEAHGTGTILGDPIEVQSLTKAFRNFTDRTQFCAIGSVKPNIGHLSVASGVTGLLKVIMMLKHKQIPGLLNFNEPNRKIDFVNSPFYINTDLSEWEKGDTPRRAGICSFGMGGTNGFMVVEEYDKDTNVQDQKKDNDKCRIVSLSAASSYSLEQMKRELSEYITNNKDVDFDDLVFSLIRRKNFENSWAAVCNSIDDLNNILVNDKGTQSVSEGSNKKVVYTIMHGNYAVDNDIISAFSNSLPGFKENFEYCKQLFEENKVDSNEKITALNLAFSFVYSIVKSMIAFVKPDIFCGDDFGKLICKLVCSDNLEPIVKAIASAADYKDVIDSIAVSGASYEFITYDTTENSDDKFINIKIDNDANISIRAILDQIANAWTIKDDVKIYGLCEDGNIISLPAYPYERKQCLVDADHSLSAYSLKQSDNNNVEERVLDWMYIPSWKRIGRRDFTNADSLSGKNVVIFKDENDFDEKIKRKFTDNGCNVIEVRRGEEFKADKDSDLITINESREDDYAALFEYCSENSLLPDVIVNMWNCRDINDRDVIADTTYFYNMFHIAKSLDRLKISNNIDIIAISNNMYDVLGNEKIDPYKSLLIGPMKVIPQEYNNINCYTIDISDSNDNTVDIIYNIANNLKYPVVAVRNGFEWIESYEKIDLKDYKNNVRVVDDGVYWIIGGLGTVGIQISEHISKLCNCKLILTGRSKFPDKKDWDLWSSEGSYSDPQIQEFLHTYSSSYDEEKLKNKYHFIQNKIRRILNIEKNNCEVYVINGDVSDELQVKKVIENIKVTFGGLNGVIHSAVSSNNDTVRPLMNTTGKKEAEQEFESKVYGIPILEKCLRNEKLDFVILFSSLSSFLGGMGLVSYTSANAFIDTYVKYINRNGSTRWLAINWDHWQDIERENNSKYFTSTDKYTMSKSEAFESFRICLSNIPIDQVIVCVGELEERIKLWVYDANSRSSSSIDFNNESINDSTENIIKKIWEDALGETDIDIDEIFYNVGGHSLMALQIISKIESIFGYRVQLRTFLENPTIRNLAKIVDENLGNNVDAEIIII